MPQTVAWIVSVIGGVVVLAAFVMVARSAGVAAPDATPIATASASARRAIFWGLAVAFVPIIGYSLTRTPYTSAADAPAGALVIDARGTQWAWVMSPTQVAVGQPVEIRVTGADVNHALGLYNPRGRLITQTQAMPGYTNVLRHTFTEAGTYEVLCLEYCGLGHHSMKTRLTVIP